MKFDEEKREKARQGTKLGRLATVEVSLTVEIGFLHLPGDADDGIHYRTAPTPCG